MDDYMDKQTAADLLDNLIGMVEDTQENDYDTALKMGIEALKAHTQPEQRWIPCSERLPKDHEPKLLTHEVHYITGKVIKDVRMAYYDDENDNWLSDEESPEILCYPLAWMPLPEPYKEVEQNG